VGNIIVPIVQVYSNLNDVDIYSTAMSLFMDGIRVDPERAQPLKTKIQLQDLVGEWTTSSESSVIYVNDSGGYAGTSFVAYGTTYKIAANGTYHSRFAGISNGTVVREEEDGVVEIQSDLVVFHNTKTNHMERYRWISTQSTPNGSMVITLMPPQYPTDGVNVRFYGTKLLRVAP